MIQYSPSACEPVPAELPTSCAKLEIRAGPLMPCGTAPGRMRPDQVNHLIVTLGVLGSAVTGTVGAILIVRIAPGRPGLALAELVFALAFALVIAAYGIASDRGRRSQPRPASDRPGADKAAAGAAQRENI